MISIHKVNIKTVKYKKDLIRFDYIFWRVFFLWILYLTFGMIFYEETARADEAVTYDSHGRRDPFVPLVSLTSRQAPGLVGVERIEDITIEGVVYDPKRGSVVIVNGTVLKEGEEFGSLKVAAIRPEGADFILNGTRVFKSMYRQEETKESYKES